MWATIEQVSALTDVTVSETTRTLAASAIELHTGLIEEVARPDVTDRDRYWLRLAVCYQAAWLASQPDYLERNAVTSANADGQSATAGNADWLTLAPLARKALKRLSWRSGRTIQLSVEQRRAHLSALLEQNDDRQVWEPLT